MKGIMRATIFAVLAVFLISGLAWAQAGTLFVKGNKVGIGTATPATSLEVKGSLNTTKIRVVNNASTTGQRQLVELLNNGGPGFQLTDNANGISWKFAQLPGGNFEVTKVGSGGFLFRFDQTGNLVLRLGRVIEQSSREVKKGFESVDGREVLNQVLAMPIQTWSYTGDKLGSKHIGPMAEHFHASFGLGLDNKTIATSDATGVALAAIQGLSAELAERDSRIANLESELSELRAMIEALSN